MKHLFDDYQMYQHFNPRIGAINSASHWALTELRQAASLESEPQPFCMVNDQVDPDFITMFESKRPRSDQYLLHRAPGWDRAPCPIPLILVHGAALDAGSFANLFAMGHTGLQQHLLELGHRIFAVTFSHSHGDNLLQAEILADAIQRVRTACRVPQVDVVAHSKGGIAARIYLSGLSRTPYRGDVRRFVTIGTPHLGLDWAFRNPTTAFMIYLACGNGAIAWDRILSPMGFLDVRDRSIYADGCFPGQCQMLYNWEEVYPLDPTQTDWWTSYHGGWGYISHSRGLQQALEAGGQLISRLEQKGLEPGIELAVLAGSSHIFDLVSGDSTGPGDGIIFVDSALNTDAMLTRGARLLSKTILPYNHVEILWKRRVADWIHSVLS